MLKLLAVPKSQWTRILEGFLNTDDSVCKCAHEFVQFGISIHDKASDQTEGCSGRLYSNGPTGGPIMRPFQVYFPIMLGQCCVQRQPERL